MKENFSDEEDIPLFELQRFIRAKEIIDGQQCKDEQEQTVESEPDENPNVGAIVTGSCNKTTLNPWYDFSYVHWFFISRIIL